MDQFPRSGPRSGWSLARFTLTPGRHTLRWRHEVIEWEESLFNSVWLSDISIRNARIPAVTFSQNIELTHLEGVFNDKAVQLQEIYAKQVFGVHRSDITCHISKIPFEIAANKNMQTRLLEQSNSTTLYDTYVVAEDVKCMSSGTCAHILAIMGLAIIAPRIIANPIKQALTQPLL